MGDAHRVMSATTMKLVPPAKSVTCVGGTFIEGHQTPHLHARTLKGQMRIPTAGSPSIAINANLRCSSACLCCRPKRPVPDPAIWLVRSHFHQNKLALSNSKYAAMMKKMS